MKIPILPGFKTEPVLVTTAIGAVITLLVSYGVDISEDQRNAILGAIVALLALFARSQVTSEATQQKAGVTTEVVAEVAADRDKRLAVVNDRAGAVKPVIALLLALALGGSIACASRAGVDVEPETAVLDYAGDVLNLTADLQAVVNDYARQHGTNAATDAIAEGIRDHVLPRAVQLREAVASYHALTSPDLKDARANDIAAAISALVASYAELSGRGDVAELATAITTTQARVNALVAQIRLELAKVRGAVAMQSGRPAFAGAALTHT